MNTVLVTGSSGLVGSACVRHFHSLGWRTLGFDNHARLRYFGLDGCTAANGRRLYDQVPEFDEYNGDVSDNEDCEYLFRRHKDSITCVIHAAAQPSHDYATREPALDFRVNALGTLNMLEATRRHAPEAAFIFLSTNKVYGDAPNELTLAELETRYEYGRLLGISEGMRLDRSRHSIFGANKAAADLLVQEYGRTYGMKTVCFRAGCLTGGDHAGAELHGFLAYLARCVREGRPYRVYGYKGKQVRDQLHADDVALACSEFVSNPKVAAVYNLGGGYANSISVLEAIKWMERLTGKRMEWSYVDEPRGGDHICYYTDTTKFRNDYPGWEVTRNLESILEELCLEKVPA